MDKWDKRFMDMCEFVATVVELCPPRPRGGRHHAALDCTGYNGAPSGIFNCRDKGECMRDKLGIPSGTRQEMCYAVHAEQNAIIQAAKLGVSVDGATLYCTHQPCTICTKMIINSGITRVVYKFPYPDEFAQKLFDEAGIAVERFEE